jgi:hypothetical protein
MAYLPKEQAAISLRCHGYGSPTKPVRDARAQIVLLRRLSQADESGIILGQVMESIRNDNTWETSIPVPNCKIVVTEAENGRQYAAFTDCDGNYEFEPLPQVHAM